MSVEAKNQRVFIKRKDKKSRIFHRLLTGLQIAKNKASKMRFLTLTSGPVVPRPIKESFDILRLHIERADWYKDGFDGFKFNKYYCLRTKEGPNGVLHVIYWGGNYIPEKWLSNTWEKIHWAYKVDIRACWTNRRKVNGLVGYLLPYLTEQQPIERISYGWKWAWLGFCKSWKNVKQSVGLMRAQGSMRHEATWATIEKAGSTEKEQVPLVKFKDRYRSGAKAYWQSLTWFPLPTTRKIALVNPNSSKYRVKWRFNLDWIYGRDPNPKPFPT